MTKLVIICGPSFAGKSTLATAVRMRLGHNEVDVDVTKTRLYGTDARDDDLDWKHIYAVTDEEMAAHLSAGTSVVDGSRNFRKFERTSAREIARRIGVPLVTVHVDTPELVARARLMRNLAQPTRVDWGIEAFDEIARLMEPPSKDERALLFRYREDVERWIDQNLDALT